MARPHPKYSFPKRALFLGGGDCRFFFFCVCVCVCFLLLVFFVCCGLFFAGGSQFSEFNSSVMEKQDKHGETIEVFITFKCSQRSAVLNMIFVEALTRTRRK